MHTYRAHAMHASTYLRGALRSRSGWSTVSKAANSAHAAEKRGGDAETGGGGGGPACSELHNPTTLLNKSLLLSTCSLTGFLDDAVSFRPEAAVSRVLLFTHTHAH